MNERRPLPARAAPGQTYGKAAEQVAGQRAVPMASTPVGAPTVPAGQQQQAPMARPGVRGDPLRPTEMPDQPLTAGAPFGPGPGPLVDQATSLAIRLRAAYMANPSEDLRYLIEELDAESY
jgi:hypothetical protein